MADPVLVVVPPETAWRGPWGIRAHRSPVSPAEVMTIDDAEGRTRLTTPLRTAWDIGTLEPLPSAVAYLDAMVRAGHVTNVAPDWPANSAHGRWGARRFATVAPYVDGRSQSRPESLVRVACLRAGLPTPVPQFVVVADGQFLGRVDLAWPEARLIVEYEGEHHVDGVHFVDGDRRYERLMAVGWRVIRLSAADLRRLDQVVVRIRQALGPAFLT